MPKQSEPRIVHVYGTTGKPFGVCAWINVGTRRKWAAAVPSKFSKTEAEFRALVAALKVMPRGATVEATCSSAMVNAIFDYRYPAPTRNARVLLARIRREIYTCGLNVTLYWLPAGENRAKKIAQRYRDLADGLL